MGDILKYGIYKFSGVASQYYRRITNLCVKNILRIVHYKVYSMRLYLCDLIDFFQRTAVSIQILCSISSLDPRLKRL